MRRRLIALFDWGPRPAGGHASAWQADVDGSGWIEPG